MRWTSFVGGILVLTLMDAVLAPDQAGKYTAAGRAGGALSLVGSLIRHVMSPAVPLIADHSLPAEPTTTGGAASAVLQIAPSTAPAAPAPGLSV